MSFPTIPVFIEFEDWANQIRIDLNNMDIPNSVPVSQWRDWAQQVVNFNSLQNIPYPTKLGYPEDSDWKKWACFFVDSVNST